MNQQSETNPTEVRSVKPNWLVRRAMILIRFSAIITVLMLFASSWWVADLFVHFRVQISIGLLLLTLIVAFSRKRGWIAFGLVMLAINAFPLVPYLVPRSHAPVEGAKTWRLMTTNVLTSNQQHGKLIDLIDEEDPDFVVVMEINRRWASALSDATSERYQWTELHPRDHNFGIGMLSRHPWTKMEVHDFQPIQVPWLQASFELEGSKLELTAVHPLPPMNFENFSHRNAQLKEVGELVAKDRSRIVTGDFNLTPWSPWFRQFTAQIEAIDAARGFGVTPTWEIFPTIMGGIKIDHALVSDDLNVTDFRVGPSIGSDHRSIIVDFQFKKKEVD